VRSASKATMADDPPTAPLPESHELEGEADFSNWLDKGADVSLPQAITGLGTMLGLCYVLYSGATSAVKNSQPAFTLREFPQVAADIPTFAFDNNDPRRRE
jgi:hypothetical protein